MGIWIRATAGFTASCTAAHFLLVHAVRGILPGALAVSLNGLLLFRHHCLLTGEPAKTVRKHFATQALAGSYLIAHAARSHKTQHEQNDEDRKSNEAQYLRDSNEGSAYSAKTKDSQNHAYHTDDRKSTRLNSSH